MPFSKFRLLDPPRAGMLSLLSGLCLSVSAGMAWAAAVSPGDVTATLRPAFFVDDALIGGSDVTITQPTVQAYIRSFAGLLNANQGVTPVTITGFGFAANGNATNNNATGLAVTFTYLGADEAVGGGDDVLVGSATGTYAYGSVAAAGEYVLKFDTPLAATLDITGVRFLIQVAPTGSGGKITFKSDALTYETASGPKFSVSGTARSSRVNLAKFQKSTASSVNGQMLATYLTDGVVGNDNRWQSTGSGPHWAQVTFPHPVEIGSAQVFSGVDDGSAMTSFRLQYLSGSTWLDVPGATVTGNTSVETNLVFTEPVTASAFRIFNSTDATARVKELALYPPNGPAGFPLGTDLTLNLAHKKPTVATASTAGNFALEAVDGRAHRISMWQTSLVGSNTLEIDLRVDSKIGSAHVYSGSTGVSPLAGFVLRYWDGVAWLDIPGGTVEGNASAARVVSFTSPVITSRVQLVFSNATTSSVQELCIFPANSGNAGYPIGTGVVGAPAPTATFGDFDDAFYNITSSAVSRFITTVGGLPGLGQTGATTAQGQYQLLFNHSNATYRLINRETKECLSGAQLSTTPGALLVDAPYSALPDQDWILQPIGGGNFYLINPWSGLALDTQGGSTAAGTRLVQNPATGATSQRWKFTYSTHYPKKGIGGTFFTQRFKANWAYNWGLTTSAMPTDTLYNPMQWGSFNWNATTTAASTWKLYSTWRTSGRSLHLMGFNEPDKFDQSGKSLDPESPTSLSQFDPDRTIGESVRLWPRLMAMDQPLVAPCPANMTSGWLASFYTQSTNLGYRVDYTANHSYPGPGGGSADGLIAGLLNGYNTWGRPMWLTEFSFVDWGSNGGWTEEDTYNCLAEFLWRAESLSWLHKYALFVFTEDAGNPQPAQPWSTPIPAPRSNSVDLSGNLTAFGQLYAAWDNVSSVVANKSYFIHNRGTRKRLANAAEQANATARDIRVTGDGVDWTLVPAPTSGQYYLVSSLDGRRLSSNGTSATMVAPGTTGTAVQWRLTEREHGWFYVDHPASTSKRLQLAYNNTTGAATYTMAASTTTTDAVQWRFIVPLATPTWTGASGASWATAGNWSSNTLPTSLDPAVFGSASTANLSTTLGANFDILGLTVEATSGPVSIGGPHSLQLGTGGINLSAATQNLSITAPLILGASQSWNVTSGMILSVNTPVSGDGTLNITGAGKVVLGGASTSTGGTTIAAGGTLQLGADDVLPDGDGFGDLIVNGTLDLNGFSETVNGITGTGRVDSTSGAGVLTLGGNDESVTVSGIFRNTGGSLTLAKTGSGTLILNGVNTHGGGFINHGTGAIEPKNNGCFGSGPVVLNNGSLWALGNSFTFPNALTLNGATLRVSGSERTLAWSGPVSVTADSLLSSEGGRAWMTLSGGLNMSSGGHTLTVSADVTSTTVSAPITGSDGTILVNLGTLQLNAANTFGGTFRSAGSGILRIGNALAFQNATLDLNAADTGSVNLNNLSATIGALSGSRNLALGSVVVSIGNNHLSTTYSGVLSGSGSLAKIGDGTLTLSRTNLHTGATSVNGGTLALGANNVLPATALSIGNATLNAGTFTDTLGTLDVTSSSKIHLGTGAALAFASSSAISWSGGTLNLTGSFVSGSSLRFGTNGNGLTAAQLLLITHQGGGGPFTLDRNGYLIGNNASDFTTWQSANSTVGAPGDDHDNDGVSNGIEYFLGGKTNTAGFTPLPGVARNGEILSVTWTKSADYAGTYPTHFAVETSETLTAGTWTTEALGSAVIITGNQVKYTFPASAKKFARLKVTGP